MEIQFTRGKTPLFFQKALVEEIKSITKDMLFKNPFGDELLELQIFEQALPIPKKPENYNQNTYQTIDYVDGVSESGVFKCPWCVVKLESGIIPGINENQNIEVVIGFGIFNNGTDNNGHEELLNLIQKVYARFACDPLLDKQFTCAGAFEWALQEEDTYPYFFGAIATTFKFMGYQREVKF